jgi:hypothetical protein
VGGGDVQSPSAPRESRCGLAKRRVRDPGRAGGTGSAGSSRQPLGAWREDGSVDARDRVAVVVGVVSGEGAADWVWWWVTGGEWWDAAGRCELMARGWDESEGGGRCGQLFDCCFPRSERRGISRLDLFDLQGPPWRHPHSAGGESSWVGLRSRTGCPSWAKSPITGVTLSKMTAH